MTDFRRFALHIVPMAVLLCACAASALAGTGDGTVLGVTRVVDNGPDAERYNLVVLAEGFTSAQQDEFNNRVTQLVNALFNYPPIDTLTEAFNITRVNVASNQAGADMPLQCGGEGLYVNTYFDATYCAGGIQRALVVNNSIVFAVLNSYVPAWDQAVVVVNSTLWGGTGGSVAVTSVASGWEGIVLHEFGHSAFGFADEYEYWAGCGYETDHNNHPAYEPSEPNVTIETVKKNVKWNDLIETGTPVPTTTNADCSQCDPQGSSYPDATVGTFEGAHYYHCDCYRPQFNCMMRNLAPYFCAVCRRVVENDLGAYLPAPNQAPVAQCQNVTVAASGGCGGTALAEDVDNGSYDPEGSGLQRSLSPAGPYPVGANQIYLIVSDGELADSCEATVTVEDTTPPSVSCPGDIAVTLGPRRIDTTITYIATAWDECGGAGMSVNPVPGSVFGAGTTQVECIGTDTAGNKDTCYFNVTVTLTCLCPYQCDFDADGFYTAIDLSSEIDALFAGGVDPIDPGCPSPRGDFDCDNFTTALDLSNLIDLLFAGGAAPCNPCVE